ncbi:MAG: hypothetical protein Sylvanvirus9_8 [Sylvanvirus sp.]|uniref:Uncharacterized protein n=1 Tax=Sylvanvirus sp. TaxID=2487774 RepID=A0A3G5AHZ0_9VIRU|nr:MAG: hypothetical protein Sylvanvirus9_8 [Sylvanvirus sp.]
MNEVDTIPVIQSSDHVNSYYPEGCKCVHLSKTAELDRMIELLPLRSSIHTVTEPVVEPVIHSMIQPLQQLSSPLKRKRNEIDSEQIENEDEKDEQEQRRLRSIVHPSVPKDIRLKMWNGYVVPETAEQDKLSLAQRYPHPLDSHIIFEEKSHLYYLKGIRLPISVTGFIGMFEEPFIEDETIERMIKSKNFPLLPHHKKYHALKMWYVPAQDETNSRSQPQNNLSPWFEGAVLAPLEVLTALEFDAALLQLMFRVKELESDIGTSLTPEELEIYKPYSIWCELKPDPEPHIWSEGAVLVSKALARKEIKALWALIRDDASPRGTFMHLCAEYHCNNQLELLWTILNGSDKKYEAESKELLQKYANYCEEVTLGSGQRRLENVSPELQYLKVYMADQYNLGWVPFRSEHVIYDEELKLAGSVDMQLQRIDDQEWKATPAKRKQIKLVDWKRTLEISEKSKYNTKMRPPLGHLEDCNKVHYNIQLSVYKYLLAKNYETDSICLAIVQSNPTFPSYNELIVEDMIEAVKEMVKHRKAYLWAQVPN